MHVFIIERTLIKQIIRDCIHVFKFEVELIQRFRIMKIASTLGNVTLAPSYRGKQFKSEYIFPPAIHVKIFHYLKSNIYMDLIFVRLHSSR